MRPRRPESPAGPLEGTSARPTATSRALRLVLLVEYAEDAFYREAIERDALTGELKVFARQVAEQERQHLDFSYSAGRKADARPRFDFGSATRDQEEFADTAAGSRTSRWPPTTGRPPT